MLFAADNLTSYLFWTQPSLPQEQLPIELFGNIATTFGADNADGQQRGFQQDKQVDPNLEQFLQEPQWNTAESQPPLSQVPTTRNGSGFKLQSQQSTCHLGQQQAPTPTANNHREGLQMQLQQEQTR